MSNIKQSLDLNIDSTYLLPNPLQPVLMVFSNPSLAENHFQPVMIAPSSPALGANHLQPVLQVTSSPALVANHLQSVLMVSSSPALPANHLQSVLMVFLSSTGCQSLAANLANKEASQRNLLTGGKMRRAACENNFQAEMITSRFSWALNVVFTGDCEHLMLCSLGTVSTLCSLGTVSTLCSLGTMSTLYSLGTVST